MEFKNRHWIRKVAAFAILFQVSVLMTHVFNDHSNIERVIDLFFDGFMLFLWFSFVMDWFQYRLKIKDDGINIRPFISPKHFSWDSIYSINAEQKKKDGSLYSIQICCLDKFLPSTIFLNREETAEALRALSVHIPLEKWKSRGLEILKSL